MDKRTLALTISALGVGLNIILATIARLLHIPFMFFDTAGTILSAVLLGPFYGAVTGIVTNMITALVSNPVELPFALVNMVIGIVVGVIAKKFGFGIKVAVFTGVILSVVAPLVGTPIAVFLYGGLAGGTLDLFTGWLVKSGQRIFTAAFFPRVGSNLIDKVLSCVLISIVVKKLPKNILNKIKGN